MPLFSPHRESCLVTGNLRLSGGSIDPSSYYGEVGNVTTDHGDVIGAPGYIGQLDAKRPANATSDKLVVMGNLVSTPVSSLTISCDGTPIAAGGEGTSINVNDFSVSAYSNGMIDRTLAPEVVLNDGRQQLILWTSIWRRAQWARCQGWPSPQVDREAVGPRRVVFRLGWAAVGATSSLHSLGRI